VPLAPASATEAGRLHKRRHVLSLRGSLHGAPKKRYCKLGLLKCLAPQQTPGIGKFVCDWTLETSLAWVELEGVGRSFGLPA
jgi:hypothetical protein